jgi:peptidyl-prolyl cis-trans isomerase B (cyclophilin B)
MTPGPIAPLRALGALAILVVALAACSAEPGASGVASEPPASAGASASTGAQGGEPGACPTSQPEPLAAGESRTVTIATSQGDIAMHIEADLSPIAAGNFVALAECGYYDGVVFHRLVPGFVIQGGDPDGTGTGGPGYTIADEPVTATYGRGTIAMARTAEPDSVGSQFFVVLDDAAADALAYYNTYQIIGTVTDGMDVVDAIAAMPNSGEPNNAALEPVAMDTVTVTSP